ncbi:MULTISPECIES: ParB N-terminal domain-containing protein [Actinomycetes]|jgi:ParB family transcriptional regulator, chromosome partitioning protein|uniref:ParB-like nuclease n=2 Tax=Actinomycetes TaxID=1760 RepID=A0A087DPY7_9BIFI|nr:MULTISPECIES: ParB N-terminal domain-containing protein [Actinomycetes]KFI97587.1 ParB-like nuclease [Bifidobacterium subtile]MCH3974148.1 ParB N-terminal domain-containing protein [Bifidobacterium tibiigranuli]QOL37032.1 ParB N-terminal domain-containing protein [Bifidobacterium subtile]SER69069.1 chromosome partitioning protein, ParB family [Propionibacterium cyclohexanicum]
MNTASGHIELDRAVASIRVGQRHRRDLGDLNALVASIQREGLLQPITITPDGLLVCGARRLAAVRALGWKTVNVWVRSAISDRLAHLLAEQDDNMLHKELTPLEAEALYREIKQLLAEDASRRQTASRFSADNQPGSDGPGKFPAPSEAHGDAREQAAATIPGGASYKTLEKVGYLREIAANPTLSDEIRQQAADGLAQIEADAPVHPIYQAIRSAVDAARQDRDAQLHRLADEALARVKDDPKKQRQAPARRQAVPARYPVRAFNLTWGELYEWWERYDFDLLARELTEEQAEAFYATAEGTATAAHKLRALRDQRDGQPRLHAL